MKKLLTTTTITLAMIGVPGIASASHGPTHCADGYTLIESVGGPLCVGDIYVESDVFTNDLSLCEFGAYQGACLKDPASFTEPERDEPPEYQGSTLAEPKTTDPPEATSTVDDPATVEERQLDPAVVRLIAALISLLSW